MIICLLLVVAFDLKNDYLFGDACWNRCFVVDCFGGVSVWFALFYVFGLFYSVWMDVSLGFGFGVVVFCLIRVDVLCLLIG